MTKPIPLSLCMVLLLVALLPLPARAADWLLLSMTMEGGMQAIYIDQASVYRQADGHYRVWTKREDIFIKAACEAREKNSCKDKSDPVSCRKAVDKVCPTGKDSDFEQLTLYEVSCTGQMRRLSDEGNSDWFYVRPDTVVESIQRKVCK